MGSFDRNMRDEVGCGPEGLYRKVVELRAKIIAQELVTNWRSDAGVG